MVEGAKIWCRDMVQRWKSGFTGKQSSESFSIAGVARAIVAEHSLECFSIRGAARAAASARERECVYLRERGSGREIYREREREREKERERENGVDI
jgi:hypothetical protein